MLLLPRCDWELRPVLLSLVYVVNDAVRNSKGIPWRVVAMTSPGILEDGNGSRR